MSSPFVLKPCDAKFTQAIKNLEIAFSLDGSVKDDAFSASGKALNQAKSQSKLPLSGLGLAVKDLFHIEGLPTAAGNPDWLATHSIPKNTNPKQKTYQNALLQRTMRSAPDGKTCS